MSTYSPTDFGFMPRTSQSIVGELADSNAKLRELLENAYDALNQVLDEDPNVDEQIGRTKDSIAARLWPNGRRTSYGFAKKTLDDAANEAQRRSRT